MGNCMFTIKIKTGGRWAFLFDTNTQHLCQKRPLAPANASVGGFCNTGLAGGILAPLYWR